MLHKLIAWIVSRVDNRLVIHAFELMRKIQRLKGKINRKKEEYNPINEESYDYYTKESGGFIENQNAYDNLKFGVSTMKASGCEIIATYNLLYSLGKVMSESVLMQLITDFEKDGMVYSGKFGTAPKAIWDYLCGFGLDTRMTTHEEEFDKMGADADSLILTMFNDGKNVFKQIHTINISKVDNQFIAHNVYGNGSVIGPFGSITEVISHIHDGRAKGISLIGVYGLQKQQNMTEI